MLIRPRTFGAKIEAVYGEAEPIVAADMDYIEDLKFTTDAGEFQRNIHRPSLSPIIPGRGRVKASYAFKVEFMGSGTPGTAPFWGKYLRSCGFSETIVASTSVEYKPATSSIPGITLKGFLDGLSSVLKGARGSVGMESSGGGVPMLSFNHDGLWDPFSDANAWKDEALLVGSAYPAFPPKPFIAGLIKIDSYYPVTENISWNINNTVTMVPDANTAGIWTRADITDRKPTGEFDAEAVTIVTKDFVSLLVAKTAFAFEFYIGAEDTGLTANGTGSLNTMTDTTKAWIVDKWNTSQLRDSAGTVFAITSNTATTLTVVGTPASGDYQIYESGKLIKVSMPKCVITGLSDNDKSGIYNFGVPFGIFANVAAGNDEISILNV